MLRYLPPDFKQRCQAYRTALEKAANDGSLDIERGFGLADVRQAIGLEERDARRIEAEYCQQHAGQLLTQLRTWLAEAKQSSPLNTPSLQPPTGLHDRRRVLAALVARQQQVLYRLGLDNRAELSRHIEKELRVNTFRLLVMGPFQAGKSSLINALLGGSMVATGLARPPGTPPPITEVKWNETPAAIFHFDQAADGTVRPPIRLTHTQYLAIMAGNADAEVQSMPAGSWARIELLLPLDLLRDGLEIVELPGEVLAAMADSAIGDCLQNADGVLFVFNCDLGVATDDRNTIGLIRKVGHEQCVFACNRWDHVKARDQQRLRQYWLKQLTPFTRSGNAAVFFTSAVDSQGSNHKANALYHDQVPALARALHAYRSVASEERVQGAILRLQDSIGDARRALRTHLQQRYGDPACGDTMNTEGTLYSDVALAGELAAIEVELGQLRQRPEGGNNHEATNGDPAG